MRHKLQVKGAIIEVIDHPQNDVIILNIYPDIPIDDRYEQVIMQRHVAKALGYILIGESK